MHLVKFVFSFIAVGGAGYALFRLSHDAPPWVKVLSFVMGIATLIGAILVLPQALDALEQSAERVSRWFAPSELELKRRAEEEARRRADDEARRKAADEDNRRQREEEEKRAAADRLRELDARRKAEEAVRRRAEEEAARDARRRAEEEVQRQRQMERDREEARREAQRREAERAGLEEKRRLIEIVRRDRCQAVAVCPPGKIFSLERGECILLQYYGGVIPGSQDDARFDSRTGRWIPNCR